MRIGELVWLRQGPEKPAWGLVVNELVIILTDNHSAMVSYEVLSNNVIYQVDLCDLLRFHYYNKHLYDTMDS